MLCKVFITFATLCLTSAKQHLNLQNLQHQLIMGSHATQYQFPYQVSVEKTTGKKSEYTHICSGAIISLTWVATTAYCVSKKEGKFRVVAGMLDQKTMDIDVQVAEVEAVVVHPDYKGDISDSDLALLQLSSPLAFTKSVQPISICTDDHIPGAALLSSWKVQTKLKKSYTFKMLYYMIVYISTDQECKSALYGKYDFSDKVLCSEKMGDELLCPGEIGSPLVSSGNLVGLTSWAFKPCGVTVYTKISHFCNYIAMYVKDL